MIVSGYNTLPDRDGYLENDEGLKNILISNAMARDRFNMIVRSIHFSELADEDLNDRMWKLRPFTDRLKANFVKNFVPEQNISYDESMIAYYGRHGCKQFIKGKPIRFGFKVWSMNSYKGYLINFEMYQGNNARIPPEYEKYVGKCAAPLLTMIDDFTPNLVNLRFNFFFDNLFTGMPLVYYLAHFGYSGTGTMRDDRMPNNIPLLSKKILKKKPRGNISSCKTVNMKDDVTIRIVKWVDNFVVAVASSLFGKEPVAMAKRYSKPQGRVIVVPRPNSIEMYNTYMGGTDRMDQNVAAYRIRIRLHKWWWCIFTWCLDAAIQNALLIWRENLREEQKKTGSKTTLTAFDFRRQLSRLYCKTYSSYVKIDSNVRNKKLVPGDPRYDGINHWTVRTPAVDFFLFFFFILDHP